MRYIIDSLNWTLPWGSCDLTYSVDGCLGPCYGRPANSTYIVSDGNCQPSSSLCSDANGTMTCTSATGQALNVHDPASSWFYENGRKNQLLKNIPVISLYILFLLPQNLYAISRNVLSITLNLNNSKLICSNAKCICSNAKFICSNAKCICSNAKCICSNAKYICSNVNCIFSHSKCNMNNSNCQ